MLWFPACNSYGYAGFVTKHTHHLKNNEKWRTNLIRRFLFETSTGICTPHQSAERWCALLSSNTLMLCVLLLRALLLCEMFHKKIKIIRLHTLFLCETSTLLCCTTRGKTFVFLVFAKYFKKINYTAPHVVFVWNQYTDLLYCDIYVVVIRNCQKNIQANINKRRKLSAARAIR